MQNLNLSDDLRALLERPLSAGAHGDLERGYCLLERHDALQQIRRLGAEMTSSAATAIGPYEVDAISDSPDDVASVLRAYGIALNDALLGDGIYQRLDLEPRLRACEPLLTDTASATPEQQLRWGLMALDWLIRDYLPTWLRLVPALVEHADGLAALAPLTEPGTDYAAVGTQVREAAAARAAARDAAWDAAWAAAWAAASAAASDAASAAARDAARDAARAAAWDAAWDAARDAARAAAWAAARDAAQEQLAPTVRTLQESALALFERMLAEPWRESAVSAEVTL